MDLTNLMQSNKRSMRRGSSRYAWQGAVAEPASTRELNPALLGPAETQLEPPQAPSWRRFTITESTDKQHEKANFSLLANTMTHVLASEATNVTDDSAEDSYIVLEPPDSNGPSTDSAENDTLDKVRDYYEKHAPHIKNETELSKIASQINQDGGASINASLKIKYGESLQEFIDNTISVEERGTALSDDTDDSEDEYVNPTLVIRSPARASVGPVQHTTHEVSEQIEDDSGQSSVTSERDFVPANEELDPRYNHTLHSEVETADNGSHNSMPHDLQESASPMQTTSAANATGNKFMDRFKQRASLFQ